MPMEQPAAIDDLTRCVRLAREINPDAVPVGYATKLVLEGLTLTQAQAHLFGLVMASGICGAAPQTSSKTSGSALRLMRAH